LFFDGGGLCVFYKRLDRGTFRIPGPADEGAAMLTIGERELEDLLDGIDLEPDTSRRKPTAH
jgi:transposase